MILQELVSSVWAHREKIVAVLSVLVLVWKNVPAKTRAALEVKHPRVVGLIRSIAAAVPDIMALLRTAKYQVVDGLPRENLLPPPATVPEPIEPAPKNGPENSGSSMRGFAQTDVLGLVFCGIAALTVVTFLAGCPLPPPDNCTPGATRCSRDGKPQRCSSTAPTRWWQDPTTPACVTVGSVCCRAMSPYRNIVHACVPQVDCLPEVQAHTDGGVE